MRILVTALVFLASGLAACGDDKDCKTNADCPQGRICRVGLCALDPNAGDGTVADGEIAPDVTLTCDPAQPGDLVLNEVLADPPAGADVDGNGVASANDDEFVEVVNVSSREVALSNVQIDVGGTPTVAGKRVSLGQICLPPSSAKVLFGSGGLPTLANSSGRVALVIDNVQVQALQYGSEGGRDSSMTLSPQLDPSSSWVLHKDVGAVPYSPGKCSNGNDFPDCGGSFVVPDGEVTETLDSELIEPPECDVVPVAGDLIVNEIMADPGPVAGGNDSNGDGVVNTDDDEFVEIVNTSSSTLLLAGLTLHDATSNAYAFPAVCLAPNQAVVVFGDYQGTGNFAGVIALNGDGLSLNNGGDAVILKNAAGEILSTTTYGSEADADQSIVRTVDLDAAAGFVRHSTAANSGGTKMSPGRCQNGNAFPNCAGGAETSESASFGEVVEETTSEVGNEVSEVLETTDVSEEAEVANEVGPSCGPAPVAGDLVLNEVLFDPPADFDANGDGAFNTTDDEFVEIVNVSGGAINLAGVSVGDTNSPTNYTFRAVCLEAGEVVVVYGKGAQRFTADGMVVIDDTKHGLSLNNSPPEIVRITSGGVEILNESFATIPSDQSSTRSPDLTGPFTTHKTVGGGVPASPGKCIAGTAMPACLTP